jgi:hypothetical protein
VLGAVTAPAVNIRGYTRVRMHARTRAVLSICAHSLSNAQDSSGARVRPINTPVYARTRARIVEPVLLRYVNVLWHYDAITLC